MHCSLQMIECSIAELVRESRKQFSGVEQLAGASGQTALHKRILATADRLDRLGGLPLPHAVRLRAVAASGTQAAVYMVQ